MRIFCLKIFKKGRDLSAHIITLYKSFVKSNKAARMFNAMCLFIFVTLSSSLIGLGVTLRFQYYQVRSAKSILTSHLMKLSQNEAIFNIEEMR